MLEVTTDPPGVLDESTRTPDAASEGVTPGGPGALATLSREDLDALVARARAAGARSVTVAAHPTDDPTERLITDAGFTCVREMLQLRRPLPAAPAVPDITVRAFDPALDERRWLEVNRRAFAWHPDQGTWTTADLNRRLAEPWFDPAGFLVHDGTEGTGIDAFCWTKVHPPTTDDPAMGEIFVIGVDPAAHGQGLGRAMVLAGLDHLHQRGLQIGMLFVEADNTVGRHLYETLGFTPHEVHRWYRADLVAS